MRTSVDLHLIVSELKENLRLRLGIVLIIVILSLWASLLLGDIRDEQKRALDVLLSELRDVQSVADESFWQDQLNQQVTTAKQVDIKVWQDQSPSLLAANFQGRLYSLAAATGIIAPEIRTSTHDRIFRDQELFRLRASIKGYYRGSDVVAFLDNNEKTSDCTKHRVSN